MAPKYTLTYFNGRGYAEISRLILAQAGVDYVDKRVEKDQWPELKKEMPFGHLPVLDVDGSLISESRAIARFLAREHGLTGKDSLEAAKADAVVDAMYDIMTAAIAIKHEANEAIKEEMTKKFLEGTVPPFLKNLEVVLEKNKSGFLVGDSVTWADIGVAHGLSFLRMFEPKLLEPHQGLVALEEKILGLPLIKEWIEKRPQTEF